MTAPRIDTVITGGTVVSETASLEAAVAIDGGRIVAVGDPALMPSAREIIDATDKMVLPGIIDVHVHFREPGMTHKEDWETGSRAAAAGGVTTVFEMPNTDPPVDTVEHFQLKKDIAERKSLVDFGLYGLLSEQALPHLAALAEAGVCGYKLFLGNTTGNLPCPSDGAVLEGFEIIAGLGLRCSIHAENAPILFWRENKLIAAGRTDALAHLAARTDVVALEALCRSCVLADWTGARIHIVHESCAGSLPYIRFFKDKGVDLTVETLPQYLYLDVEMMLEPGGEMMRMNPPVRQKSHQAALWAALTDGTIDMISTDHAPHAPEEKAGNRIWDIACGMVGVETSVPLMLTAVAQGRLSLANYVRAACAAPARAFGLYGRKGVLQPGADADVVIVDLNKTATLSADRLHSRGKAFPYEGMTVRGLPVRTLVRGRTVAVDGVAVGEPGWGQMVRPKMTPPTPRNRNTTTQAILTADRRPW